MPTWPIREHHLEKEKKKEKRKINTNKNKKCKINTNKNKNKNKPFQTDQRPKQRFFSPNEELKSYKALRRRKKKEEEEQQQQQQQEDLFSLISLAWCEVLFWAFSSKQQETYQQKHPSFPWIP